MDLLERSLTRGRVLLQSAGGTGKTSILQRLRVEGMVRGILTVYVNLREWAPEMFGAWDQRRDSEPDRFQLLLDTLTSPPGVDDADVDLLELVDPQRRLVLMVDGLNEVPSGIGDSIISVVDAFARDATRGAASSLQTDSYADQ